MAIIYVVTFTENMEKHNTERTVRTHGDILAHTLFSWETTHYPLKLYPFYTYPPNYTPLTKTYPIITVDQMN